MFTKTKIALAAALMIGSASVALAEGEFDPNLGNRYPAYNEPFAAQGTFHNAPVAARGTLSSAPVALRNGRALHTAPVRLYGGESFTAPTQDRQEPGYPQAGGGR